MEVVALKVCCPNHGKFELGCVVRTRIVLCLFHSMRVCRQVGRPALPVSMVIRLVGMACAPSAMAIRQGGRLARSMFESKELSSHSYV